MTVDDLVHDVDGARAKLLWPDAPDVSCDACGRRIYPQPDDDTADIAAPHYRPHQARKLAESGFDHQLCYYCSSRSELLVRFFARVLLRAYADGIGAESKRPILTNESSRPLWEAAL